MNRSRTRPDDVESPNGQVPPLEPGDRLTRAEFERRYEAMPRLRRAELLNGVVHMPSPVRHRRHGRPHARISGWLLNYEAGTPGVEISDNGTVRLAEDSEPQPDVFLFILPEHGGRVRISDDDYVEGTPELMAEVAASSVSYDVHVKRPIYQKAGVQEHILWRVLDSELDWFSLRGDAYQPLVPDAGGVVRSEVFPGLWLDVPALLRGDMQAVLAVVQQGLASPEHAAFVAQLAQRRAGTPPASRQ